MEHGLNRIVRPLEPADPATVFISYAWEDEAAVIRIERALQERGVRVLRDKRSLPLGGDFVAVLGALIDVACDAILFYVSDDLLKSDFVWRHEVPRAIARSQRQPEFHIIPILSRLSFEAVNLHCMDRGLRPLGEFNAIRLSGEEPSPEETRKIAARTLRSALSLRISRHQPDDGPVAICMHTFPYTPPAPALHLDIDWTAAYGGTGPSPTVWQSELLPALADIHATLAEHRLVGGVEGWLKCRLPAAVALGHVFSVKGGVALRVWHGDAVWSAMGPSAPDEGFAIRRPTGPLSGGDPRTALIEVGVSRDTTNAVTQWRRTHAIVPAWRIECVPTAGPSRAALATSDQARTWSRQIGDVARDLWDREGVHDLHLFIAAPAEFALLVGQQLRDRRPVHVYFGDNEAGYRLAVTLGQEAV